MVTEVHVSIEFQGYLKVPSTHTLRHLYDQATTRATCTDQPRRKSLGHGPVWQTVCAARTNSQCLYQRCATYWDRLCSRRRGDLFAARRATIALQGDLGGARRGQSQADWNPKPGFAQQPLWDKPSRRRKNACSPFKLYRKNKSGPAAAHSKEHYAGSARNQEKPATFSLHWRSGVAPQ